MKFVQSTVLFYTVFMQEILATWGVGVMCLLRPSGSGNHLEPPNGKPVERTRPMAPEDGVPPTRNPQRPCLEPCFVVENDIIYIYTIIHISLLYIYIYVIDIPAVICL